MKVKSLRWNILIFFLRKALNSFLYLQEPRWNFLQEHRLQLRRQHRQLKAHCFQRVQLLLNGRIKASCSSLPTEN